MPAPTTEPSRYAPPPTVTADDLEADQPIWVYRNGSWRPGIVLNASARAALVRYRPTDSRGTAVDTVDPTMLARRNDPDPLVDAV